MGGARRARAQMTAFQSTLETCRLADMGFYGSRFTWSNKQYDGMFIKERVDRVLATSCLALKFPNLSVEILPARSSDHTPLYVSLNTSAGGLFKRRNQFRFESWWQKKEGFKQVVQKVWRVKVPSHDIWEGVKTKIGKSQIVCKQWRRVNIDPNDRLITEKTKQLGKLQVDETEAVMENIKQLRKEVNDLIELEDLKWRQKAKQHWLQFGDKNSKYFHACVNQRRKNNQIKQIQNRLGVVCREQETIEEAFVDYFKTLFQATRIENVEKCLVGMESRITDEMNEHLLQPCTPEEVSQALQQMGPLKAPGPDGFSADFYQQNWGTVGDEVCRAISKFISIGVMDLEINATHIVLVPKKPKPTSVSDFRPISLCNVIYKLTSKVLANRLKGVLPFIISANQSAFIPGRLISDNILAAYETLHSMQNHHWGKVGHVAVKLDMSKAYDRVEWRFLDEVMRRMGFARKWRELIMQCIQSVNFSVLINGQKSENFQPSRGIRQGDPLSPYLFIICAEALSNLLAQAENSGWLSGVPTSPKGPCLNHLFFADDSLLFCRAISRDWGRLSNLLECYERASGQLLNKEKTSLFFSRNTSQDAREYIQRLSGVPSTQRYDKYLGLPALVGKSRVREFQNIKDRVWKKLHDWKTKFLSQAGKEILLKAVIQAIPTYSMSVFLLPQKLCMDINSMMQKFWWGHKENDSKIHWMSWKKLGSSKSNGGMGFRDLRCFNTALLAKQGWRLLHNPHSLAGQILKAKYFPRVDFLGASLGRRPSFAWRSIMSSKDLIQEGMKWRIGNGNLVKIWGDKWLPTPTTYKVQSPITILPEEAVVRTLIDDESRGWKKALVNSVFSKEEADIIFSIPLSKYGNPDMLIWRGSSNGEFTVRSAYYIEKDRQEVTRGECSNNGNDQKLWKLIWGMKVPNPVKVFIWRACQNILPTKDNLQRKGISLDPLCLFCKKELETAKHILWDCPSAVDVWGAGGRLIQKSYVAGFSFAEVMEYLFDRCSGDEVEVHAEIARRIWFRRNSVVH
jgi:hypothetical protein